MNIYFDYSDEELKGRRKEYQGKLREVENEIHRRREEKFRAPHWYCMACDHSYYKTDNICPVCGNEAQPFNQSVIALDILEEERNG